jgi:hypothetical protein
MQLEGSHRSERTSAREAEGSTRLEAVAREQLVKTQQVGEDIAVAVVICKVWGSAMTL